MGTNKIISGMFAQMAEALVTMKENPFKIAAYKKASKVLAEYPVDVAEAYKNGGLKALTAIPGIGVALSKKIAEYIDTKVKRGHPLKGVLSRGNSSPSQK